MDRTLSCVCHYRSLLICITSSLGPPGTAPDFSLPIYCAVSSHSDGMSWDLDAFENGPTRHDHHRSVPSCFLFFDLFLPCGASSCSRASDLLNSGRVCSPWAAALTCLLLCVHPTPLPFPPRFSVRSWHRVWPMSAEVRLSQVWCVLAPSSFCWPAAKNSGEGSKRWRSGRRKKRGSRIPGRLYASKHSDMLASSPYPHEQNITFCALTPQDLVVVCYNS